MLKRAGNPFRNYFARNPDDEVCARYHVPELFAAERDLLHAIIDLYRYDPMTHSEVVPVLGNKGAGKTHLLHSIKHGSRRAVATARHARASIRRTPSSSNTCCSRSSTRCSAAGSRRACGRWSTSAINSSAGARRRARDLTPRPRRWNCSRRRAGPLGAAARARPHRPQERAEWLAENLSGYSNFARMPTPLPQALADAGLTPQKAFDLLAAYVAEDRGAQYRRADAPPHFPGFAKAAL